MRLKVNNLAYNLSAIHVHMLTYGMDSHDMAHVQKYCLPYLDVVTTTLFGRDAIVDHVGQLDIMYRDYHMIQSQLTTLSSDSILRITDNSIDMYPSNFESISNFKSFIFRQIKNP